MQTDAAGERSFHYWRDASAARQLFGSATDLSALDGAEILYLSAITLAIIAPAAREALIARLAELRSQGRRIAFDSNYRPRLWPNAKTARDWTGRMWRITDIALPSADDERALLAARLAMQVGALQRTDPAAALRLGVPRSTVSRAVAALEASTGLQRRPFFCVT